jgi:hypothetical protein
MSGEAVADLAAMLAHGGSSMDVLRTELDDLESDLAPDKSDGLAPPPSGLAGLASSLSGSFSLFPEGIWPSWAVGKHADETGDATVSPATSLSATSTVHAVPPSSLPLPVPKVSKSGQTSTASQASDKNGARNTLGRKEWTADEDQIIMSEVERGDATHRHPTDGPATGHAPPATRRPPRACALRLRSVRRAFHGRGMCACRSGPKVARHRRQAAGPFRRRRAQSMEAARRPRTNAL